MQADSQTRLAIVQALLTCVIAISSGWWAYNTHRANQEWKEARHTEQLSRIDEQQKRESRVAQAEAISQMSQQLGLMEAQCDSQQQLRSILERDSINRLEERCYDSYISARAILFLSRVRIIRDPDVAEADWDSLWNDFKQSLIDAGSISYNPNNVSARWQKIVESSTQY